MSASTNATPIPTLIEVFCKLNKLQEPRDNYSDYLKLPEK